MRIESSSMAIEPMLYRDMSSSDAASAVYDAGKR
jgi:hypothetical protein